VSLPSGQVVQLIIYFSHDCAIADKHNAGYEPSIYKVCLLVSFEVKYLVKLTSQLRFHRQHLQCAVFCCSHIGFANI